MSSTPIPSPNILSAQLAGWTLRARSDTSSSSSSSWTGAAGEELDGSTVLLTVLEVLSQHYRHVLLLIRGQTIGSCCILSTCAASCSQPIANTAQALTVAAAAAAAAVGAG